MNFDQVIKDLTAPLSPATRAEVLNLQELLAIRARLGAEKNEHRKTLVALREKIPGNGAPEIAKAGKGCAATTTRVELAKRELTAAQEAHKVASAVFMAAELAPAVALLEVEKELYRTADDRLGDGIFQLKQIDNQVRNEWRFTEFRTQNKWTGQGLTIVESNMQDIVATRAVLQDSIAELDAMRLAAVTRDQVTEHLRKLFASLTQWLTQFDLAPPVLNEVGEVEWVRRTPSLEAMQAANLAPKDGSKWIDGKLVEAGSKK